MNRLLKSVCASAVALMIALPAMAADTLRVGTEAAYPPFNSKSEAGELVGFDIDIANAICVEMKVKCEFVTQAWDGIIPALQANKFDAIVSSMSITEERKAEVLFTDKYYTTPARFVVPKGETFEFTKDGLKGKTIGVQKSTVSETYLKDNFGDVATIKAYDTQDQLNADLAAGRVDLLLADQVLMLDFLKANADYEFQGPQLADPKWFGEGIGIAVRKDDTELAGKLNAAIKAIRDNGTYNTIAAKYFDFDIYGEAAKPAAE